jgi:glycosyltransferase involved in cell wall biosynthesis
LLNKYNIPSGSLRVCYIGRHNEVKGYAFLRKVAKEIWKKEDVYFIVGGTQAPLKGLNDKRWIELGWVKTPELLNCIDVFILPNKETYFDIILLEVLRQGVPVIISKTGGNKWFASKNMEGIKCFEYGNIDSCVSLIQRIVLQKKNGLLPEIGCSNKEYFCKELSMARYIENYVTSLEKLS